MKGWSRWAGGKTQKGLLCEVPHHLEGLANTAEMSAGMREALRQNAAIIRYALVELRKGHTILDKHLVGR